MTGTAASARAADPSGTEVPNQNNGQATAPAPSDPGNDSPNLAPDGANNSTNDDDGPTAAELLARNAALEAELEKERGKREKAIQESKSRKDKLREVSLAAGEYEPVINDLKTELATVTEERDALIQERDSLLAEVQEVRKSNEARRAALLSQIPDADRALFDSEKYTVAELERMIDRFFKNSPAGKGKTPEKETPSGTAAAPSVPLTLGDAISEELRAKGVEG